MKINNRQVDDTQQIKKYQLFCLKGQLLMDIGDFDSAFESLMICHDIYEKISPRYTGLEVKNIYPLLLARFYGRKGEFQ
jgi:hypothetical protein